MKPTHLTWTIGLLIPYLICDTVAYLKQIILRRCGKQSRKFIGIQYILYANRFSNRPRLEIDLKHGKITQILITVRLKAQPCIVWCPARISQVESKVWLH